MSLIKYIFSPIINIFFYFKFIIFFKKTNSMSYVILDIDNTIAKTWQAIHTLKKPSNYEALLPLNGTIKEIKLKHNNTPKIFISNRNITAYKATLKWLLKYNLINTNKDLLILTSYPYQKLKYIRYLASKYNKMIYYYDDLSYNHENGNVKFYSNLIKEIENMDINYFDYHHIKKINCDD